MTIDEIPYPRFQAIDVIEIVKNKQNNAYVERYTPKINRHKFSRSNRMYGMV